MVLPFGGGYMVATGMTIFMTSLCTTTITAAKAGMYYAAEQRAIYLPAGQMRGWYGSIAWAYSLCRRQHL